jgi:hypothetical protein
MTLPESHDVINRLSLELQRPALHGLRSFSSLGVTCGHQVMIAFRLALADHLTNPDKLQSMPKWIESTQCSEMLLGYFVELEDFKRLVALPRDSPEQIAFARQYSGNAIQRALDLENKVEVLGSFGNFCLATNPASADYWPKVYERLGIVFPARPILSKKKVGCLGVVLYFACAAFALLLSALWCR